MTVAAIVGSAFAKHPPTSLDLAPVVVETEFGDATLHRVKNVGRSAFVLFRHGLPHRLLPHQINYRANTAALAKVGVGALLVTSSVGVLNPDLEINAPMVVKDLIHIDNRLPDGSACTMFVQPSKHQAHLVVDEGLFSSALTTQVKMLAERRRRALEQSVTFAYVPGPRTKTRAENDVVRAMGADVNSMSLAPEVTLANEMGIPCAAVVVGHKPSRSDAQTIGREAIAASLENAQAATTDLVVDFLAKAQVVPFRNTLFRF